MFYDLPSELGPSKPQLERFFRENLALQGNQTSARRRPAPVRNLTISWAAPNFTISWTGPQNMNAVLGFNIYKGNENTRVANINNPLTTTFLLGMPTGTTGKFGFWISCYNQLLESLKTGVIGTAV